MKRLLLCLLTLAAAATSYGAALTPINSTADFGTLSPSNGDTVAVKGYYAPGDAGGGTFTWSDTDTSTVDYGVVFPGSGSGAGRWIRNGTDLTVRMFGAKGDGVAEDANAIQRAFDTAEARGYTQLRFGGGRFRVSGITPAQVATDPDYPVTPRSVGKTVFQNLDNNFYTILVLGELPDATPHPLTILGEGATIFTDQELYFVQIMMIRPNFKNLVVQDLTLAHTTITTSLPNTTTSVAYPAEDIPIYSLDGRLVDTVPAGSYPATGLNRPGLQIGHFNSVDGVTPVLNVDSVTLRNITFYDCHRSLGVDGPPASDYATHNGGLKILNVENCNFLYPHGANIYITPPDPRPDQIAGGGQAFRQGTWVDTCYVRNCYFDGAQGDQSAETNPHAVDGFLFGSPLNLVVTDSTLVHFGIEGIANTQSATFGNLDPSNNPATYTVPAVGGSITVYLGGLGAMPAIGSLVYLGDTSVWTLTSINYGDASIVLTYPEDPAKPGHVYPGNPPVGSTIQGNNEFLSYTSPQSQTVSITGCSFDGEAAPGLPTEGQFAGYGGPGIRVDSCHAYVGYNTFRNCLEAILTTALLSGAGMMDGSEIVGNNITMPPVALGTYKGIDAGAKNMAITGNKVYFPVNGGSPGISISEDDNQVTGNIVSCATPPSENAYAVGILIQSLGSYLDGNETSNFPFGISSTRGGPAWQTFTVDHHTSYGDAVAVSLTPGATWLHQTYSYSAPVVGWYRIAYAPAQRVSGTLSIAANDSPQPNVTATVNWVAYGGQANLEQLGSEYYSVCPDFVLSGMVQPEFLVRLTGSPDPYTVKFDTEDSFFSMLPTAEAALAITSVTNDSPGQTTITTAEAHGLSSGNFVHLLKSVTYGTGYLGAFAVVSTPSPTTFVVSGVPTETPDQYLSEGSNNLAGPYGLRVLQFDSTGQRAAPDLSTQLGTVLTGAAGPGARTPDYIGEYYIDTTNHQAYVADGGTAGAWLHLPEGGISGTGDPSGTVTGTLVGELYLDTATGNLYTFGGGGTFWHQVGQTVANTYNQDVQVNNGTNALPSFFFGTDRATGLYSNGSGTIGFSSGGNQVAQLNNQGFMLRNGSATGPSFFFSGDNQTGLFSNGTGTIGFASGGSLVGEIESQGMMLKDGSAAAPSLFFSGDNETGIFSAAAGKLNLSVAGSDLVDIDGNGLHVNSDETISGFTVIRPAPVSASMTFPSSGPYAFSVLLSASSTHTNHSVELTLDGASPGTYNVITPPAGTLWTYTLTLSATGSSGGGGTGTIYTRTHRRRGTLKCSNTGALTFTGTTTPPEVNDGGLASDATISNAWTLTQGSGTMTHFKYMVDQTTGTSFNVSWTATLEVVATPIP